MGNGTAVLGRPPNLSWPPCRARQSRTARIVRERHDRTEALSLAGMNTKEIALATRQTAWTCRWHLKGKCQCEETPTYRKCSRCQARIYYGEERTEVAVMQGSSLKRSVVLCDVCARKPLVV